MSTRLRRRACRTRAISFLCFCCGFFLFQWPCWRWYGFVVLASRVVERPCNDDHVEAEDEPFGRVAGWRRPPEHDSRMVCSFVDCSVCGGAVFVSWRDAAP